MKRIVSVVVVLSCTLPALAGSLDPAAPPAPTMKPLTAVEPRVAVDTLAGSATAQFLITAPGSYYLTGNLQGVSGKSAIQINANDVTLDLRGFAVTGTAGALEGIATGPSLRNLTVMNGAFRGWPNAAVNFDSVTGCAIRNVLVDGSGTGGVPAIFGGFVCTIDGATVLNSGDTGIFVHWASLVTRSTVRTGITGIFAQENTTITDCNVSDFGSGGIVVQNRGLVAGNTVRNCGIGISVGDSVIVRGNSVSDSQAGLYSEATGASFESNTLGGNAVGIHISGVFQGKGARIQDNEIHGGTTGILVDSGATRNIVIRNLAYSNTTNYSVASGNTIGPIVNSTAGGTITNTNPWANFSY